MTDADLAIEFEAAAFRAEVELKRDIALAYHVETFRRTRKLKPLKHYFPRKAPTRTEFDEMRRDFEELKRLSE